MLEKRLESVCEENAELRASLASLHTRLALHDQLNQQHSQQVHIQIHYIPKTHRQANTDTPRASLFLQSKYTLIRVHCNSRQHKTAQCSW